MRKILAAACIALAAVTLIQVSFADAQPPAARPVAARRAVARETVDVATYVGCLRARDGGRRLLLTEVAGPDVPRTRTWRTLYLTSRPARLEVVGANGVSLHRHVDQTVQITGSRHGDVVRVHTIRVIGATCR
ncbi:MAG TPA: hypothetical protein VNI83_06925 [Vicinamibacterales bacterium]|nr:hypothetical protein [Vicinamibacterales bacterium]